MNRLSGTVDPTSAAASYVLRVLEDPTLLVPVVQPIVDMMQARVAGWEVLTRVRGTDLSPSELFAGAQSLGVAAELHVVAVRAALDLRRSLPSGTFLTFNIDPLAVVSGQVRETLQDEADLSGLVIELVESAWPRDPSALLSVLADLRRQGARLAVDDVGAGYSGLSQLIAVRPELIKLDKTLIDNITDDPAAQALVTAVSLLSGTLDAWLAVEGIETEEQVEVVSRLGIPLAQGYYFGHPQEPWPTVETTDLEGVLEGHRLTSLIDEVGPLARPTVVGELVLGDHGTPTGVVVNGSVHPAMTVAPSTQPAQALAQAMKRSQPDRFVPLVVTSPIAQATGLVDVDTLVRSVISDRSPIRENFRLPSMAPGAHDLSA